MLAVRGNIEYSISEAEKNNYIKNGFDILDDEGKKIADGEHKTISFEKYKELEKKYKALESDYKKLEAKADSTEEIENLKVEIEQKDERLKVLEKELNGKDEKDKTKGATK